jgi:hypothetical protein
VTLCGPDDWEPTALSICIWIGLELLLCRQRGKLCSAGRLCRGVDALRSFWKRKIPGWKLSALDKKKIDNCIGKHISEGSMVRCTLDAMFKKVMPDAWEKEVVNFSWKLTTEELMKIEYHIHIREGNMVHRKLELQPPSKTTEGGRARFDRRAEVTSRQTGRR